MSGASQEPAERSCATIVLIHRFPSSHSASVRPVQRGDELFLGLDELHLFFDEARLSFHIC